MEGKKMDTNENKYLIEIKKDNIFVKIKNWFKSNFRKKDNIEKVEKNEEVEKVQKIEENHDKNLFRQFLIEKAKTYDDILLLQEKFENGKIEEKNLNNEQINQLKELYKKKMLKINKKNEKLKNEIANYKNALININNN